MKTRECIPTLMRAGISYEDAMALRRASMTLRSWFEYECGTGEGQVTRSIERETEEDDSQPYMRVQYPTANGYVDRRWKIADREKGARKRIGAILAKYPGLSAYVQGDCRGASLYILRPGDVPEGSTVDSCYSNGLAVYQ